MKLNDTILMFSVNDMSFTYCSFIINNINEVFGVFNNIIFKYSYGKFTIVKNREYNISDKKLFLNMFKRITFFTYRFYIINNTIDDPNPNINNITELDNFIHQLLLKKNDF